MSRPRSTTDVVRRQGVPAGAGMAACSPGFFAAIGTAPGEPARQAPNTVEASAMMSTHPAAGTRPFGALALALLFAAAAWYAAPARAEDSGGDPTKALVAAVPRDGTGWSNGRDARLVPRGDGRYQVEYEGVPLDVGAGHPGEPVIVGNSDGNPIIEYLPPRPRRWLRAGGAALPSR